MRLRAQGRCERATCSATVVPLPCALPEAFDRVRYARFVRTLQYSHNRIIGKSLYIRWFQITRNTVLGRQGSITFSKGKALERKGAISPASHVLSEGGFSLTLGVFRDPPGCGMRLPSQGGVEGPTARIPWDRDDPGASLTGRKIDRGLSAEDIAASTSRHAYRNRPQPTK